MRFWYKIHKWISVVCAAFFLLLCLTGLPLLFKAEIQQANQLQPQPMHMTNTDYGTVWDHLPEGAAAVAQQYPGKDIKSVSLMHGQMMFRVQDKKDAAPVRARMGMGGEQLAYDVQSGTLAGPRSGVKSQAVSSFMHTMHRLHMYFGLGSPGMIFLGLMCFLSFLAVVSGIILYKPFMKRESFGAINGRSAASKWFSWHKFLGISTGLWTAFMCLSGVMIVVFSLSYGAYIDQSKAESVSHIPPHAQTKNVGIMQAVDLVQGQFDDKYIVSIDLPDKANSDQYVFYLADARPQPADYMGQMVFVNADESGQLSYFTRHLPLYLPFTAVMLDMHIHNHNLIALKIIWALLDIAAIVMIAAGFAGWYRRYYKKAVSMPPKQLSTCTQPLTDAKIWIMPAVIAALSAAAMILPLLSAELSWLSAAAWIAAFILSVAAYIKHRK